MGEEAGKDNTGYSLERAICGVCGEGFTEKPIICPECHAPHHDDCWYYIGGCATYGCPGRDTRNRPRFQPPSRRPIPRTLEQIVLPDDEIDESPFVYTSIAFALGGFVSFIAGVIPLFVLAIVAVLFCWLLAIKTTKQAIIDVQNQKLFFRNTCFGYILSEEAITHLDGVKWIEIARSMTADDRVIKRLVVWFRSGQSLVLTRNYYPNTEFEQKIDVALMKLERATELRIYTASRPVSPLAEAMAKALKHTLPIRRRPR